MKAQWILYNQCNTKTLKKEADAFLFLQSDSTSGSPYGALNFHPISKIISYAIGYNFIDDLDSSKAYFINCKTYKDGLKLFCKKNNCTEIFVMVSSENYMNQHIKKIKEELQKDGIKITAIPNNQFICSTSDFKKKYSKPPIMEVFYRRMRKKENILMQNEKPIGGKRNYDKDNRKFDSGFKNLKELSFKKNIGRKKAVEHYKQIGVNIQANSLHFPTNREQALKLLKHFIDFHLDRFGELEDAMYQDSSFVHHSLLSTSINFGLLSPMEVIKAVEETDTAINNKEGFIRQVLGRREYMYQRFNFYKEVIYSENFFQNNMPLPDWFWRPDKSEIEMNCVNTVLKRVESNAYSHHIERLMIIGNFTLLVGYNPHDVNKRFREQYADAFERVVTPNVLGMSQFADGGKLATKPYVSSANYVNKMSNYCKGCKYDPKEKYGEKACPLNYLYRNFINKNKELLKKGRQSFIIKNLEKIDLEKIESQVKDFVDKVTKN